MEALVRLPYPTVTPDPETHERDVVREDMLARGEVRKEGTMLLSSSPFCPLHLVDASFFPSSPFLPSCRTVHKQDH